MKGLHRFESGKWLPIYMKIEESQYFLNGISSNQRFPKLVLFHFSAFLSAARSITFHVQKQIAPEFEKGKEEYKRIRDKHLITNAAKYFRDQRNYYQKQAYLPLGFELMERYPNPDKNEITFVMRASAPGQSPSKYHFTSLEEILNTEYSVFTQPRWLLEDYPDGKRELLGACQEYLESLEIFTEDLRRTLES